MINPKILKGAIVSIDILKPVPNVIYFQYNPTSISRKFQPRSSTEGGSKEEVLRINNPPSESIDMDLEIDATDQLEKPDEHPITVENGIYPQLSSLELLLYPNSGIVIANKILAASGTLEISPPVGPLTLLIMGPKRILPVKLTSLSITEEEYDINLNPIRAKASVSFDVLTYNDFSLLHPANALTIANQISKETLSILNTVNSLAAAGASIPF
ncbi:MAG: hypothetical protein AB7V56_11570 [Candidatus Nitrosocosmicus sp.]